MKELNGTITLAFVEEDNKQRVIFRVIPLCTREGSTFHGTAEDFPDEGSLRVVPDKREQSTFKERMREINGLCAIHLISEGKELMKVRQNRNYSPEQGERNQYAIYSDVVCEFTPDGCFEVVEAGGDAAGALTAKVLLHKDKMLYGPVDKAEASQIELSTLKPFGNDSFLLHSVETKALGKRQIYWNPESTLNWRQRRGSLRRRDRAASAEEAPVEARTPKADTPKPETQKPEASKPEARRAEAPKPETRKAEAPKPEAQRQEPRKPEKPQRAEKEEAPRKEAEKPARASAEKPPKMDARTRRVERAAEILRQEKEKGEEQASRKEDTAARAQQDKPEKPVQQAQAAPEKAPTPAAPAEGEALPIGTWLDILDTSVPFEEQISKLAQPLSESANRLSSTDEAPQEEEPPEAVAHFSGTPLNKASGRITRSKARPENVHAVVEKQIRQQRDAVMGTEMGASLYGMLENPIENLRECLEYVWQNADMREQAMNMLMENESFISDVATALRRGGMNLQATAAAREQLAEIEADRLSALMQLENEKANERKFREQALASLSQRKRDEVERLKNEVRQLEATRKKLSEAARVLSSENAQQVTDFLAGQMSCLSGAGEQRVLLSPVIGHSYTQQELAEQLRVHMNASGFSISDDDAMSLLISFSLYDAVCLRAHTVADAQRYAALMLESFGLQSVSATICPGAYVEMISLLPEDTRRTPTVTVQPLGTETMSVFGHKTIFLTDESTMPSEADMLSPYPIINVPVMAKSDFGRSAEWEPVAAAALSSFAEIRADAHPMLNEAEKWFNDLKRMLAQAELDVPEVMMASMRRFIEVASRRVRGGFLAAADTAVCHWVVPMLLLHKCDAAKVAEALVGLPRTLDMLGIQ